MGCYHQVVDTSYLELNERVTLHLLKSSMLHNDYHADLLPYSKMKWSADQAAIIIPYGYLIRTIQPIMQINSLKNGHPS